MLMLNTVTKNAVIRFLYFIFLTIKNSSFTQINEDNIFSCSEGFSGQNCDGI
jgi:hypothetical protein